MLKRSWPGFRIMCAVTVSSIITCGQSFAAFTCEDLFKTVPALTSKTLWDFLAAPESHGSYIIDVLSRDPKIAEWYRAPAGVWEGYTVREHTQMVFGVFDEQFPIYASQDSFRMIPDLRLLPVLRFAIALHDIGKPCAILAGNKNLQHEFTVPILERAFDHFGFSKSETKLAKALVGNDVLGDWTRGIIDAPTARSKLGSLADEAGLPVIHFAALQFLFYTVDAASYPSLRQRIFTTLPSGMLVPQVFLGPAEVPILRTPDRSGGP